MMNLADPQLELTDPTPDIHSMFLHFDKTFFWEKLHKRCIVRWSKRMYSCAGTCSYEGKKGLCNIGLSEPLLKLRPRKDLVETLLHEMIHAFLFITNQDQDRDGHGPKFQAHMHRINAAAGINISIFHAFHNEVKLYQTHWWRCNGPCRLYKPQFGIVRRSNNRAPGPADIWWKDHEKYCKGTFIKIKEPQKPQKNKNTTVPNQNTGIVKYIINNNNNNSKEISNKNIQNNKSSKPVLQDSSNVPVKPPVGIKSHNTSTLVVSKKYVIFKPHVPKSNSINDAHVTINAGQQHTNANERQKTGYTEVIDKVRNIWANEQPSANNMQQISNFPTQCKKPEHDTESPHSKLKKIDDYFKTAATSLLKDLYGEDFNVRQSKDDKKLKAVPNKVNFVVCPVCWCKVEQDKINRHLDECLNKDIIKQLSKESFQSYSTIQNVEQQNRGNRIQVTEKVDLVVPENGLTIQIHDTDSKDPNPSSRINVKHAKIIDTMDLTNIGFVTNINRKRSRTSLEETDFRPTEGVVDAIKNNNKLRKSDCFTQLTNTVQTSPTLTKPPDKIVPGCSTSDNTPKIKIEPGCSTSSNTPKIKIKPGCSKSYIIEATCPCCGKKVNKSVAEHLDECLSFFENNTTIPVEGGYTSHETVVIMDDDTFDDSQIFNATGTKLPCPGCLEMIEENDMNNHLDICVI